MRTTLIENKKKESTHKAKQVTLVAGLLVMVGVLFAVQIFLAARFATTGQDIIVLERQKVDYEQKIGILEEEIAQLSSMPVLERKAKEDLSMSSAFSYTVFVSEPPSTGAVALR